jgi:hypothetical protein
MDLGLMRISLLGGGITFFCHRTTPRKPEIVTLDQSTSLITILDCLVRIKAEEIYIDKYPFFMPLTSGGPVDSGQWEMLVSKRVGHRETVLFVGSEFAAKSRVQILQYPFVCNIDD